jgi:hypothetical protein
MEVNPRIATCSGKPYMELNGRLIAEKCGDEHSVGMTKFYRVAAFRQIGGFVRELMWDGIDGHRCRMLGWIAVSWNDPELRFIHLRPMGTSHKSWWTGRVRHGVGQHYMGTGPIYLAVSACSRVFHPPFILGSLAIIWGYVKSSVAFAPRYADPEFRRFLRGYQRQCLLWGKKRATEGVNQRQAPRWSPDDAPTGVA